jgi:hypothetical protein
VYLLFIRSEKKKKSIFPKKSSFFFFSQAGQSSKEQQQTIRNCCCSTDSSERFCYHRRLRYATGFYSLEVVEQTIFHWSTTSKTTHQRVRLNQ